LLACRPKPDKEYKRLPTVKDFLSGKMHGKDHSLNMGEYLQGKEEKLLLREKIYSSEPVFRSEALRTWFPLRPGNSLGKRSYVKAVDGITIDIYKGETLGLVGESGCGKTTLGRSILRLIEPSGGKVIYKGEEITDLAPREMRRLRKQLQIIFQDPYSSLNPRMTAGRAILEPMAVHKLHGNYRKRKEKVLELMEKVGLESSSFDRYPHEFSGGQRQRICIARALAVEPELIVLDEAVSALDVSVQAQVLNLLNDLKRELGLTYLFISHDLSVVKFMSDRIIVMRDGKIEEEGSPEEIYQHPGSPYTKQLIDSIMI
jgi:peptide/nickel transport system ATP-binding protein